MRNPKAKDNLTAPKFEPGSSGNPGGKTSAQRKAEVENAAKATMVRGRLLDAVIKATEGGASVEYIEAGMLKLLKDSEDRGLGTPVQSVNVESPNGTMTPKPNTVEFVSPKATSESPD